MGGGVLGGREITFDGGAGLLQRHTSEYLSGPRWNSAPGSRVTS